MNELEMLCANYVAGLNLAKEGILPIMPELGEIIEEARYDSIFDWNVFRKGNNRKAQRNGKRNAEKAKRYHRKDRYHGKGLEPYLYKEDGIIKESIEWVWHRCRMPISDRVHNKFTLKAEAREQDYSYNFSKMEIKEEEKTEEHMTEVEERILDNHYALESALSNFKEGKYIALLSFWNGECWEDSYSETNKFVGIKTAKEAIDFILAEQANHLHLPEIEMETVQGMEGIFFKWNSFYNWDDENYGYKKLTFLPLN